MKTRRGFLRAGPLVRAIATSGTSAGGSAVAIDNFHIGGNREDTMTQQRRNPLGARRRQVIVNVTAAAATMSTATVADNTVTQVASLVTNQSRRALKAPRRAGSAGIAGR